MILEQVNRNEEEGLKLFFELIEEFKNENKYQDSIFSLLELIKIHPSHYLA
jgi:hypothetical protein